MMALTVNQKSSGIRGQRAVLQGGWGGGEWNAAVAVTMSVDSFFFSPRIGIFTQACFYVHAFGGS